MICGLAWLLGNDPGDHFAKRGAEPWERFEVQIDSEILDISALAKAIKMAIAELELVKFNKQILADRTAIGFAMTMIETAD